MGEIADDLMNGASCSWCGIYFTEEHSYPVVCKSCWDNVSPKDRDGVQKAIHPEM